MSRYAAGIHPVPEVLKSRVEFTARTEQFVPAMVVLGKESGNGYIVHAELDNDTKKTDQRIEELLGDGWKINIIIEFDGGKNHKPKDYQNSKLETGRNVSVNIRQSI